MGVVLVLLRMSANILKKTAKEEDSHAIGIWALAKLQIGLEAMSFAASIFALNIMKYSESSTS